MDRQRNGLTSLLRDFVSLVLCIVMAPGPELLAAASPVAIAAPVQASAMPAAAVPRPVDATGSGAASPSATDKAFSVFGPKTYLCQTGTAAPVTDTFSVADTSVRYSLRVSNSRAPKGDDEKVSTASITLNGVTIVEPSQFGRAVTLIQVAVPLLPSNTLAVKATGPAGSTVSVEIIGGMVGRFTAFGPRTFQGATDDSDPATDTFSVSDPTSHYLLRVTNAKLPGASDKDETAGVSTGSIRINGRQVVSPRQFGNVVSTLEVPIMLEQTNRISIAVEEGRSGKLTVEVEGDVVGLFTVFGEKTYLRGTGKLRTARDSFSVPHPSSSYILLAGNSRTKKSDDNEDKNKRDDASEKDNRGHNEATDDGKDSNNHDDAEASGMNVASAGESKEKQEDDDKDRKEKDGDEKNHDEKDHDEGGVSKAVITINGTDVIDGDDFTENPSVIERPLSLVASDQIGVKVTGGPGGTIDALILGLDTSGPTITAIATPPPNANGWNNTDVIVSFTCAGSGVASCSPSQTVATEGSTQIIQGTVVDNAGNTATASVTLNIDKTPPSIVAAALPPPNSAGWNNSNVVVSFQCGDSLSGVADCSGPVQATAEGAGQIITGTVTDLAGNTASTAVKLNIDKTAPAITASALPPANGAGWNNSNVSVSFQCGDSLSGVADCSGPVQATAEGAGQIITGTVTDLAGNTASTAVKLNIDKTAPAITASALPPANGAGWNNSNVTVSFNCSDSLAGIAACPIPAQVTSDGSNQPITGTATDNAGNSSTASLTINLEKTPPTVSITSPAPGAVLSGTTVSVLGAVGALSGIVSVSCDGAAAIVTGSTYSCAVPLNPGSNTITVQATDVAGNTASASEAVTAGTPMLSLTPGKGQQGQRNLTVALQGQSTHWVAGTTTATFGAGITASLSVSSPTVATALLAIDPAAAAGPRDVSLATGGENVSVVNGFTVTAASPLLLSVTPPTGQQGQQSLTVGVTGQFTNWVQGQTAASFGPGISVASLTVTSATSAIAVLNINPDAATGPRPVTLTTGGEVASLNNGFTVLVTAALASCLPSGSLGILLPPKGSGDVTAYVPNGAWASGNLTGIQVVPIEGAGEPKSIPTPLWVTSCASNSATGETVCVGDHTDVYLITGSSINAKLQSTPDVEVGYSGGICETCGVAINGLTNTAVLQVAASGPSYTGLQFLDLATNTLSQLYPMNNAVSEDIQWDPTRNLILSPGELLPGSTLNGGFYDLIDTSSTVPREYGMDVTQFNPPGKQLDSGAEDCTTGIALSTIEDTSQLFITDVTQANLQPGTPGTWNAPGQFVNFPEFAQFHNGTSGIAVPPGSHLAAVTGEFGGNQFGAVVLPSTSGTGTPNFGDYVAAALPPTPDGVAWSQGLDPHTISAYVSPNTGRPMAVFANAPDQGILYSFTTSPPSWLALIDLEALLAAPRKADVFPSGQSCPGCSHSVDPNYDLVAHGVVRYIGAGPEILDVCPNRVHVGLQNLSVNLTGRTTHWAQGITTANFGPGITVVSLNVTSPTSATAVINIDAFPDGGPRNVTMTTGSEVETLASGFNFTAVGLERVVGTQGQQNVVIPLVGIFTNWAQGLTSADFGPGITVLSLTVNSPTSATAVVNISPAAPSGPRTVTLRTGSCEVDTTAANGFDVFEGTTALASPSPNSGQQGQQNLAVKLTGQFTHWVQGITTASFGDITVSSLTINSSTSATAILNISAGLVVGFRSVSMTTGSEVVYSTFTVTAGSPSLASVTPNAGQQGQQRISVALVGQFTNWAFGATTASFGPGITVSSLTVNAPWSATAVLNVDAAAAIGPRTVTVRSGGEVDTLSSGFAVTAGVPSLVSVNPYSGQQGQQSLSIALTGQLANWVPGTTGADFGAGITVTSLGVTSATSATALINIDPSASTGPRTVTMTTGAEVETLAYGFTVTPGSQVRLSLNPNTGQQDQRNVPIAITGVNTHFAPGSSRVDFGAGVTVAAVTVNSATSLTASVNIAADATPGLRTVLVATGGELASLDNGFTVLQASNPPGLASVLPNSGLQAQTLSVTITGQNTNFVQGQTMARFGPGVMVGTGIVGSFGPVTVTSANTATAQLTILNSALPGPRTVTLQTGSEQEFLGNSFHVIGLPMLLGTSPSSAAPGQSLAVNIAFEFTNFVDGITQVSFGPGVSVGGGPLGGFGPVSVIDAGTAVAQITIDSGAKLGPHTVVAQTGAEVASADLGFSVLGAITGPAPTVAFTGLDEGTEITAPTTITGTITSPNLDSWTLDYQPAGSSRFITFATGTTSAVSGTFDPTLLRNGNVTIRLSAIDTSGQVAEPATVTVVVTRNLKIGNFTLSFRDLTIPVAGLPIQVIRTYDSRNKEPGDFGTGWTLGLKSVTLSKNFAEGSRWNGSATPDFFPTFCLNPAQLHVVTIALPEGTTYEFKPVLTPQCRLLVPPDVVTVTYAPMGKTPPNATLAIAGDNEAMVAAGFYGSTMLIDFDTFSTFDPDQYVLTLPDGRTLLISRQAGLQTITDLHGNTLAFGPSGITSSSGKSVAFERDSQGRITQVTDPAGNTLSYAYDGNGNLASFTDQLKNTRTYAYDDNHNLLTFQDPRGVQPIRNDYDASGRLVSTTDAFGHVINFIHDVNARQEIVTDRLGNTTVNEYDGDGNVVREIDPLGGVTTRAFDSRDNKLSDTNALGQTTIYTYDANNNRMTDTDPLGNTTNFTSNSLNQPVTLTDPLNRVVTFGYDGLGNANSVADPNGNTTAARYDDFGNMTSMTDAVGNVSQFLYDDSGHLTQQTDAMGNITTFTYDANGNRLSVTRSRTTASGPESLVTSYQYDAMNRVIQTTYPDGSTTQVQYDAIGNESVTTDQLGRQTSHQYDLLGKLLQTTYPDGSTESFTYDAEGNRVTSTDRGGRTTTYVYDSLKRLVQTIYPDSSSTSTTYDAAGQVVAVTDARGNQTHYEYDAGGRRTKIIDALGNATTFTYDVASQRTSMVDANGHVTQFVHDGLSHPTKVIYPDATTEITTYDAMRRIAGKTDQAGRTTQFQYDPLGRLTQVTDALGQVTRSAYDEVGNRISQTDANGHTTTFAYDKMGRRLQRTLPLGMSETYGYDPAGNLTSKIDFNGKATTYTYDELDRLTSRIPDPAFGAPPVSFTYTRSGARQSMTDASGTTLYSYDLLDRLIQKSTPEGSLAYSYDEAGNLVSTRSSNPGGVDVSYSYDSLNRLQTAQDSHGQTTYSYDNVGNLQGYLYPNGVKTTYSYDALNRLINESVSKNAAQTVASYLYTLDPAGNRTAVSELGGRQVSYAYDAIYRLTNETIAGNSDPATNGSIGYQYDAVANRLLRSSTLGPLPAASYSYDANDRLATDIYDPNGNTIASGGQASAYDFENRLTSFNGGAVTIVYDGDGNRVAETANGVTTQYLVDDRSLTGFPQVVEEISGGIVQRVYTYGLNRISQSQAGGTSFYGYDGHGDVRFLTDPSGAVTDRYDYDAFGNLISKTGSTPNNYLFAGEQFDPALNLYYNRARYLNPGTGRFWTADTYEGDPQSPLSIHKYLYTGANPVNHIDPSGHDGDLVSGVVVSICIGILAGSAGNVGSFWLGRGLAGGDLPDGLGFGVFGAAGVDVWVPGAELAAVGGEEIVFEPRQTKETTETFLGVEPSVSEADEGSHSKLHVEGGVFGAWYWNVAQATDAFKILGVGAKGYFGGLEWSGSKTLTMLFGVSTNADANIFFIAGGSEGEEKQLSKDDMIALAEDWQAVITIASVVNAWRSWPSVNPGGLVGGGIVSLVVNGGLVWAFVNYTYGQPEQP